MPQEQERGLGNWQAELAEWAGLFISLTGRSRRWPRPLPGLEVDTDACGATSMRCTAWCLPRRCRCSWPPRSARPQAHALFETLSQQVVREGRHLRDVTLEALERDPTLKAAASQEQIERLFSAEVAAEPAARIARANLAASRSRPRSWPGAPSYPRITRRRGSGLRSRTCPLIPHPSAHRTKTTSTAECATAARCWAMPGSIARCRTPPASMPTSRRSSRAMHGTTSGAGPASTTARAACWCWA